MRNPRQLLTVLILILIVYVQSRHSLFPSFDQLPIILKTTGQPAAWRGANFFGQEFADLVGFLNAEIPAGVRVILPPRGVGTDPLSRTQYMQYFLYPREIVNCSGDYLACIRQNREAPGTYIVIVFADRIFEELASLPGERLRSFNQRYGLLVPVGAEYVRGIPLEPYTGLVEVFFDASRAFLLIGGLWISGGLVLSARLPGLKAYEVLAYGYGLGSGLFSVLLTLAITVQGQLRLASAAWILIGLLAFSMYQYFSTARKSFIPGPIRFVEIKGETWLLPVLFLGGWMIILSIGFGYHRDDALGIWAPKGYGIASDGFPDGPTRWGTLTTEYPLHIPVLIAVFRLLFNENLPESKVIFPVYAIAAMLSVYAYFRKRTPAYVAGLAALITGTVPLIFQHSHIAYANLAAAYFFLSGVHILLHDLEDTETPVSVSLFGSSMLAFAAWTRPEVLPIAVLVVGLFAWVNSRPGRSIKSIGAVLGPIMVYAVFWSIIRPFAYAQPGFISDVYRDAFAEIFRGRVGGFAFLEILRYFWTEILSVRVWGLAGWGALISLSVTIVLRQKSIRLDSIIGFIYILAVLGGQVLASLASDRGYSIEWWLRGGMDRMIMPGVVLLWAAWTRSALASLVNENVPFSQSENEKKHSGDCHGTP